MSESQQHKKALAWEQKLLEWERKLATRHLDRISEEQGWSDQERDEIKQALGLLPYEAGKRPKS